MELREQELVKMEEKLTATEDKWKLYIKEILANLKC